jgi:DNA-binding transcriptional regulator/RsmH inhibitor MraZ
MKRNFLLVLLLSGAALLPSACRKKAPSSLPPARSDETPVPADLAALFPVVQGGLWGYIDRQGKAIVPLSYEQAGAFREGLGPVRRNGLWGFVNSSGQMVIRPQFEAVDLRGFQEGRIGVMLAGRWGVIDRVGRMIVPLEHEAPLRFRNGRARVRKDGGYGFLDETGRMVIPPKYTYARTFSEGLAAVQIQGERLGRRLRGGTWGFIDPKGNWVIPPKFSCAESFSEGLAWVRTPADLPTENTDTAGEESTGYIDPKGRIVLRLQGRTGGRPFSQGLAPAQDIATELWGYIDTTGREVIPAEYDQVGPFHDDQAAVLTFASSGADRKWGYVDTKGALAIPPRFDQAGEFRNGLAKVGVGTKCGYIDSAGRFVWEPSE